MTVPVIQASLAIAQKPPFRRGVGYFQRLLSSPRMNVSQSPHLFAVALS